MHLHSLSRTLDLSRPRIVGIINATPDSYVASSRAVSMEGVLSKAQQYIDEGADILEIGGESTGPGSPDVSLEEERTRVIDAVKEVRNSFPDMCISVDTWKSSIAKEALSVGADLINDITAGRGDPAMFSVIAKAQCPVVLMYSKDASARTTAVAMQYDDVIQTIHDFLEQRIILAVKAGIDLRQIIVDPGLGHFVSSESKYSYTILDQLRRFTDLGPVLVSPSRKSFLAGPENLPVSERLPATLSATLTAVKNGASFIRTHDVGATKNALFTAKLGE
jgi:dihydropteroate synthase